MWPLVIFPSCTALHFQMKQEHKKIILKAMPYIIQNLEVDVSFLSEFESQKVLSQDSIEEILVGDMSIHVYLKVVINCELDNWYLVPLSYLHEYIHWCKQYWKLHTAVLIFELFLFYLYL